MHLEIPIEQTIEQTTSASLQPILDRYLLVTFCIPCYVDAQGQRYLENLWVKDLLEHFQYLKNFTLACPYRHETPPANAVSIDSIPAFENIRLIDLPAPTSTLQALKLLPTTIAQVWKAVRSADIVHTGVAGWPIPEGWLLTPMVRLQKKFYLIIVESAFWRLAPNSPRSLKSSVRAAIVERVNRWCVNNSDLAIFTQEQYRRSLLTRNPQRGHVINASWIDEQIIISEAEATAIWNQKLASYAADGLRILFAGRLTSEKGILVLLEAMAALSEQNVPVQLDILGEGDRLEDCEKASQQSRPPVQIRNLGTVPYDAQFFELLRNYHAIVVPSVSDEQPRIVYDAYSQGIPVLGSNTDGIRDCIEDGKTGKLVLSNQPQALADLLKWAFDHPEQLAKMGMQSIQAAHHLTHQEMHRRRWQILLNSRSKVQTRDLASLPPHP